MQAVHTTCMWWLLRVSVSVCSQTGIDFLFFFVCIGLCLSNREKDIINMGKYDVGKLAWATVHSFKTKIYAYT